MTDQENEGFQACLDAVQWYEREFKQWEEEARRNEDRYRGEEKTVSGGIPIDLMYGDKRFPMFWSIVQTTLPAIFAKNPKPVTKTRYDKNNEAARVASQMIENALNYYIDETGFFSAGEMSVTDNEITGRGSLWVRYNAFDENGDEIPPEQWSKDLKPAHEEVFTEYVEWKNFWHGRGEVWDRVFIAGKKTTLTKAQIKKLYPDKCEEIVESGVQNGEEDNIFPYEVYEGWNKETKTVYHFSYKNKLLLKEMPDTLKLENFFPFPQPLMSTRTGKSLKPVPTLRQYRTQANSLDDITTMIGNIIPFLKACGVFDKSNTALANAIQSRQPFLEGLDNYAGMMEKGGIKSKLDFVDITPFVGAMNALFQAENNQKQKIYEVTGVSDILRGATNANETAEAQKLKSQFGGMRLSSKQAAVANFMRDTIAIMGEMIACTFHEDTLQRVSGISLMKEAEKAMYEQIKSNEHNLEMSIPYDPMAQQMLQAVETIEKNGGAEAAKRPSVEEVFALLRNNPLRRFAINIETESTIMGDENDEKQRRMEFVKAISDVMQQALAYTQQAPQLIPLVGQLILFAVRSFQAGKELETEFEDTVNKLVEQAEEQVAQQQEMEKMQRQQILAAPPPLPGPPQPMPQQPMGVMQ
jgi:hypothetical protein